MSAKLSLFAVSSTAFDAFAADTSLSELLDSYLRCDPPTDRQPLPLYISETDNLRIRYVARPSGGLFYFNGGRVKILPKFMLAQIPFLKMSIKAYLHERDSANLKWVLECLSSVDMFDWMRWLVGYQRQWWIGSLLEAVEPHLQSYEGVYDHMVWLFQKLLRGVNCGKALSPADFRHVDFHFPVLPLNDTDTPMGVWQPDEAQYMVQMLEYIHSLVDAGLRFDAPPALSGLAPVESDEEWHAWVEGRLADLHATAAMLSEYPDLTLVSFIESRVVSPV